MKKDPKSPPQHLKEVKRGEDNRNEQRKMEQIESTKSDGRNNYKYIRTKLYS